MDLTTAAIATIISSIIASSLAIYLNREKKKGRLDDRLEEIIKITIQYPYLENDEFIKGWNENKNTTNDTYLRYDAFCTLLFNFLEDYCAYFNWNEKKIHENLNVKDWVRIHETYWWNPVTKFENVDSYKKEFRNIISNFLK